MSIQAMNWVLEHSNSEGNARLVLLSIANHADRDGDRAWPRAETIAHESRCDRATVFRALTRLKEMGELDWISGGGQVGSRRRSNYYWLPLMRLGLGLPQAPVERVADCDGFQENSRMARQKQSQPVPEKVAPVRLEPSLTVLNQTADEFYEPKPNPEGAAKVRSILGDLKAKT